MVWLSGPAVAVTVMVDDPAGVPGVEIVYFGVLLPLPPQPIIPKRTAIPRMLNAVCRILRLRVQPKPKRGKPRKKAPPKRSVIPEDVVPETDDLEPSAACVVVPRSAGFNVGPVVVMIRAVAADPLPGVTWAGLKSQAAPLGNPLQENAIASGTEPTAVTVTATCALPPCSVVAVLLPTASLKSLMVTAVTAD